MRGQDDAWKPKKTSKGRFFYFQAPESRQKSRDFVPPCCTSGTQLESNHSESHKNTSAAHKGVADAFGARNPDTKTSGQAGQKFITDDDIKRKTLHRRVFV